MHEPTPEQYQPRLTPWAHTWRTLLALAISSLAWGPVAPEQWQHARTLFWLDLGVGLLSFGLMFLRRRYPYSVAVLLTLAAITSAASAGPGLLVTVSLATRRVWWQVLSVGLLAVVTSQVFATYQPTPGDDSWLVDLVFGIVFASASITVGMYVGSRRELLWTLRDRAERAEAEQELRVAQARATERARIAREMHDVLAHRISLVTMHAGALAYRTDLSEEQIRETASVIQSKAHEALMDLRQVLGVLRGDEPDARDHPQPTLDDLPALVDEAVAAGMRVEYDVRVPGQQPMPDHVGRTVYRVVQEGLTNARKHAPGTVVGVSVTGSPDTGVEVQVRNRTRVGRFTRTPGAGLGLVGLAERVGLAGGRLEHDSGVDEFVLRGWVPWATQGEPQRA